ncbi:Vegetative incompatibility protein HET-E-1 [Porphyridium purpureum]|uniref:Vegetative incompatibility protein HET-E-1 n=1 Tax=Porphyridium purpureum TaxID=35688 RepID=A0A5J4YJX4_PORPP|nr:Vegetative incompatibility protein HET-E-1 [Porphyridium purpureum]|eukprot:POR1888..scf246_12
MAAVLNLTEHADKVWTVDFSSVGRLIASGSDDRTIKMWDARSGVCVRTMAGHAHGVYAVRFSPDGRFIASGSWDQTVMVWDAHTGARISTLTGHSDPVWTLDFSPDGKLLTSGSDDRSIKIWDLQTCACVGTMTGHQHGVYAVRFSPDGRYIVSGSWDQTVMVWDTDTGSCVRTLTEHLDKVWAVDFSPDGWFIASASDDCLIKVWDVQTGACVRTMTGHQHGVYAVRFSPDGRFIASGSWDQTVMVWDADTGSCVRNLQEHSEKVTAVRFSPDGRFMASSCDDKTVKMWDTSDLQCGLESMSSAADEEKYCQNLWGIADSDKSGTLDAQKALVFFSKAQLSTSMLDRMWKEIATGRGKRALNYNDFVLALRFVALVQDGEKASLARAQQGSHSLRAKLDIPGSNPLPIGARTPLETTRHEEYCELVCTNGSDEVDVQKAVVFLSKSGLRNRVLNEIWGIATSQGTFSSLDTGRFKTALRLVAMAQKGMKLDLDEAANGDMELIANIEVEATTPLPEPVGPFPGDDMNSVLAETALDDLTCEQLARVLEELLRVDAASVRDVWERKVTGEALHDMKEFQEFVQLSFPDKKKIEKWVAGRKSCEGFEEYLLGILGGDAERAERACALLLEYHAVSNLEKWLWFRKQPSKRRSMREIVRLFPELGTWPGGPDAAEWK